MTYTFGLDTFGDRNGDADGKPASHAQTIRNVADEGVFAEQAGVDFFGIGEHHTEYFPMPAGDVVLAAIAARTVRIRLGSAVTVLSSDDPVRVFQRYSTLNAISGGRAEVVLGRGSSIESFPLFGYDLADYEELFEEKATLFAELLKGGPVTWEGKTRAPLLNQDVVPHTESGPFPAPRTRSCSSAPWRSSAARRFRWACTRRATSPPPTSRRKRSSGRAGERSSP
jgi:alkanesulfonate monooxygenase SsuD/methylene tetrahydromethanopterin reductase-like flavin-dependent oxidoreductase (luciferase family)